VMTVKSQYIATDAGNVCTTKSRVLADVGPDVFSL
jgi:hypothetical protein